MHVSYDTYCYSYLRQQLQEPLKPAWEQAAAGQGLAVKVPQNQVALRTQALERSRRSKHHIANAGTPQTARINITECSMQRVPLPSAGGGMGAGPTESAAGAPGTGGWLGAPFGGNSANSNPNKETSLHILSEHAP
jgi:hypothetical protein